MMIYYGGLSLKLVRVNVFDRQPVLDDTGTDYLFTKFTIQAQAVVNSQLMDAGAAWGTSYIKDTSKPGNIPPYVAEQWSGSNPVLTDVAIRHWLSVPRRQLLVVAGPNNDVLLASPKATRFCDAHNGPICNVFSIQECLGDARTFIVNLEITTYVNECEEAENKIGSLLSNRFSQIHSLDEDYGLTVVTTGVAHFRTDLIYDPIFGFPVNNPDALRNYLFLPIPYGFKRHVDYVRGFPDSSGIEYQFSDVQQAQQFVVGDEVGATRIEANYREVLISGEDAIGVGLNAIERWKNLKWLSKAAKEEATPVAPPSPARKNSKAKAFRKSKR